MIQLGKDTVKEFELNFKAKLQIACCLNKNCSFNQEELSKAFEEIISWCINNNEDDLKRVIDDDENDNDVYKHLIFEVGCRDLETYAKKTAHLQNSCIW